MRSKVPFKALRASTPALILVLASFGCSSAKKQESENNTLPSLVSETSPQEGPSAGTGTTEPASTDQAPEPIRLRLLMDPRSPAPIQWAGFLIEAKKKKFPISAICSKGLALGIALLYARSESSQRFEWHLNRLSRVGEGSLKKLFAILSGKDLVDAYMSFFRNTLSENPASSATIALYSSHSAQELSQPEDILAAIQDGLGDETSPDDSDTQAESLLQACGEHEGSTVALISQRQADAARIQQRTLVLSLLRGTEPQDGWKTKGKLMFSGKELFRKHEAMLRGQARLKP